MGSEGGRPSFSKFLYCPRCKMRKSRCGPVERPVLPTKPDGLADFDALARAHVHARQMQVHGLVPVGVRDLHHVAFAALAAREHHAAAADGSAREYPPARRSPFPVGAVDFQDRMESCLAEMRGDRARQI